jgi:hypothetical protein
LTAIFDFSAKEIRTQDYLTAYSTTGRPPIPVPQDPAGERERVALGLPPLFEPHVEVLSGSEPTTPALVKSQSTFTFGAVKAVTEPSQLPKVHLFQPLAGNDGEAYYTISALPEFKFFSHEVRVILSIPGWIISCMSGPVQKLTTSRSGTSILFIRCWHHICTNSSADESSPIFSDAFNFSTDRAPFFC